MLEIKVDPATQRSLNYGFIKFLHHESAAGALAQVNGTIIHGRPLRIGWANTTTTSSTPVTHQLHVSFTSSQINFLVTEESLRNLFTSFGVVLDVSLKQLNVDTTAETQSGYGFIHFDEAQDGTTAALTAASALRKVIIGNVKYDCSLSHGFKKYAQQLQHQQQQPRNQDGYGNGNHNGNHRGGGGGGEFDVQMPTQFYPPIGVGAQPQQMAPASQTYFGANTNLQPRRSPYQQPAQPAPAMNNSFGMMMQAPPGPQTTQPAFNGFSGFSMAMPQQQLAPHSVFQQGMTQGSPYYGANVSNAFTAPQQTMPSFAGLAAAPPPAFPGTAFNSGMGITDVPTIDSTNYYNPIADTAAAPRHSPYGGEQERNR